jgi:hypothetical protein
MIGSTVLAGGYLAAGVESWSKSRMLPPLSRRVSARALS